MRSATAESASALAGRLARVLLLLGSLACGQARAQEFEPPPEAPEGTDWEVESADSLERGGVEVGMGASGRAGLSPRRSRRVRVSGEGLSANVRDGKNDPLASSRLELSTLGGRFAAGRMGPRWGRGLVVGSPAEPWRFGVSEAALEGRLVPRADGVSGEWGESVRIETLAGRFARARVAGARLVAGDAALGWIASDAGSRRMSVALERESASSELATNLEGAWRLEASSDRAFAGGRARLWSRAGRGEMPSLVEPRRFSPRRALGMGFRRAVSSGVATAALSLWRDAPATAGSRAFLELLWRFPHHGAVSIGCEEQRGVRRTLAALRSASRFRQGVWAEWSVRRGTTALIVREERWGDRALARSGLRAVSAARFECDGPFGARLAVMQAAYRTRRGETFYLPEAEADRLVLRSLSGTGERTRMELSVPAGGGRVRGSLALTGAQQAEQARWTIDWTRRARIAEAARAP